MSANVHNLCHFIVSAVYIVIVDLVILLVLVPILIELILTGNSLIFLEISNRTEQ